MQGTKEQDQIAAIQQPMKQPLKQLHHRVAKAPAVVAPPALSAAKQLQQHLQQYRNSMQADTAPHLRPGDLLLPYAASSLTQPGSQFMPGFEATCLDASTTLPGLGNSRHAAAAAASHMQADMWRCTAWPQRTSQTTHLQVRACSLQLVVLVADIDKVVYY